MNLDTDLQNTVQSPPQQQTPTNPPPGDPSPPTVPEVTDTPRPPPASDARRENKLRNEKLRALRFDCPHLDLLLLANARFFSQ